MMKIRIIILMARPGLLNENTILYEYDPFGEGEYTFWAYESIIKITTSEKYRWKAS